MPVFVALVAVLAVGACRDEPTTGLGDAQSLDDARDVDAEDAGGADVGIGVDAIVDGGADAGAACALDGPFILEYQAGQSTGFTSNCMPVVAPDPTRLTLDAVQLTNLMSMRITGVTFADFAVVDVTTGVVVQRIEVAASVPFPSSFEPGQAWDAVLTKTSGEDVGVEVCRYCGDEVALRIRFETDNLGCFFEQVDIGPMRCVF